MKLPFLKFVYSGLLTGMPPLTYNPITKNPLNIPFSIKPESLYINFQLNETQTTYLNNYIHDYNKDLEIIPVKLLNHETNKNNYLSVNIYNCTSPVFMNDNDMTRCEVNTYVKNTKTNKTGTLILDYISSELSMDPVNIFKSKEDIKYTKDEEYNNIECLSNKDKIDLKLIFRKMFEKQIKINDELIEYSDYIFYKNGIYDKLYYDTTLVKAVTIMPTLFTLQTFKYRDLNFDYFNSLFYFKNKIEFVGGMWNNLYDLS